MKKVKPKKLKFRTVTDAYVTLGCLSSIEGYNCIIARAATSELHIWQQLNGLYMMEVKHGQNSTPYCVEKADAANHLFKYKDCYPVMDRQVYINAMGNQIKKKPATSISLTVVIPAEHRETINTAARMQRKELDQYIIDTVIEQSERITKSVIK